MAEFIEFLSANALKELELANKELVTMVANVDNVGKKMKNISTPSGSDSAIKSLTDQYKQQEKVIQSLQQKLQRASEQQVKNVERTRIAELKLAQDREKAFDKFEKGYAKEQKLLNASLNVYNKTQRQLNLVQTAYNNLATRKERYNNLSATEEMRLKTLQTLSEKYNNTLKAVDATVGKHTRNVGNYASAFNPVSNSVNQLTREMPAFANSVQTGFMAISNNLPIFFDAMQQAIAQQKELQAQGKPSKNALQILAGGLFTLGTALSVGVTLLTLFGPKIVEFIAGSKAKKEAIEAEKKALEEKNQAEKQAYEQQVQYASSEISRSKILLETAKNVSLSYKERVKAVNELQSRYPDYLGNLSKEEILAGKTADAEYRLNDALMKRAMFLAVKDKIAEVTKKLVDSEMEYAQTINTSTDANELYDIQQNKNAKTKGNLRMLTEQEAEGIKGNTILANKYNETLKKEGMAYLDARTRKALKNVETNNELQILFKLLNQYAKYANVVVEDTKNTKINTKSIKDNNDAREKVRFSLVGSVEWFEKLKSALIEEQSQLSQNNEKWSEYQKRIDTVQDSIDKIKNAYKELEGVSLDLGGSEFLTDEDGDALMKAGEELRALLKEFKQGFIDDFSNQSGFSGILDILSGGLDKFEGDAVSTALAVSEAFQQAFNTISEYSNANYEQMYRNLKQQKDVAVLLTGQSTTAREEIEKQYEERRRIIQRRQAESQKRLAMFNIVTDTAQAILATFAKSGFLEGLPLAIAMGAIGAVQLAMVANQPIPAFEKGGIHDGGLMLVNDGKGSNYQEKVVTPDGKVIEPKGRNVVMNAPKGTQIFTHDQWLNNILLSNGIEATNQTIVKGGISKEEMRDVMSQFANKDSYHFSIDEGGINKTIMRGTSKTNILNSRLRIKSNNV